MRKGFYFSMDAVMALLIMSASMMMVLQLSDSSSSDFTTESSQYQEASTTSRDIMKLASVEKLSSLNDSYTDQFRPTIEGSEFNESVLNAISLLWANGNRTKASDLAKTYFRSKIPGEYEFKLEFGESDRPVYNSSFLDGNPSIVTSVSTLVSGHKINRSSNSYSSRALLSSVTRNKTETVFFGGFVGQGTLYYNVTLPDLEKVNRITIEGDFSGPFDLYINDEPAGSYPGTKGNLSAESYSVCTDQVNQSRCDNLVEGDNIFRINFTGRNKSVRGGLMEVDYISDYQLNPQSGNYSQKRKKLPGIDGILNYYSSFYIPGEVEGINAHLHYQVENRTVFVKAGNTTIYENRTIGEQEIDIDNETINQKLEEANMSYDTVGRSTVPFRIGLRNIKTRVIIGAIADSVAVMDVSGSMGCGFFESPPCKIDEAQNASKAFADVILNTSGNRAGFVSYNEDVVDSYQLTENDNALENIIDSQSSGGNTCIGCGILDSMETLEEKYIQQIFSRGSEWQYTTNFSNSAPPSNNGVNWTSSEYEASDWENGSALIGTTGRAQTSINKSNGSIYLRKEFYRNYPIYKNVSLNILSDSAASVYLNGELIDNDTARHAGQYWNRKIDAAGDLIERGYNTLGIKLKNSKGQSIRHWIVSQPSEWIQGTFNNTQQRDRVLELEPTDYSGTQEDVNAGNYCSVSGSTTGGAFFFTYSTYMDSVQINDIDRTSGDNGGYLDATTSISDVLVPGRDYRLNISFYTGGNTDYGTVAFDWDGDGSIDDETVQEVGSCSSNGCTVSTEISVPENASTGSTLMRVMGEEGSYHTDTCADPGLNEVEDYSVYVGEPNYENGSYTSGEFDAGQEVNWTGFTAINQTPDGTSFEVDFSPGNSTWYDSITEVPNSQNLNYNISLYTENQFETPRLEKADVSYEINNSSTEFDAALNLTQTRKKSMIVMSDGTPNVETSMQDVPDHNDDGTVDAYDHTIEAACRANEQLNATVYTVGFGSGADGELLNQTAQCGGGKYYYSSTNELEQVFRNISNSILNASFVAQTIETDNEDAQGRLYSDSYLSFNYTNEESLEFGKIDLQIASDRFGGNVSSPKQGSFYVPEEAGISSAKVTSYSGSAWTDRALINQSGDFEYFYNLSNYGTDYPSLGDPFILNIPQEKLSQENNTVRIDTALDPYNTRGGSPDNRFYYTIEAPSSVGYGNLFPNETAAQQDAFQRLKEKLTLYGDEPIVNLNSSNFEYTESVLGDQPRIWGPTNVKLVVWNE